jgi:hypothetical protein
VDLPQPLTTASPVRVMCFDREEKTGGSVGNRDVLIGEVHRAVHKIPKMFQAVPEFIQLESPSFVRKGELLVSFQESCLFICLFTISFF